MNGAGKVLIVGPSWVGDLVMAQSLFRELRERRPNVEIDVLAPAWSLPVVQRMQEINRTVENPVGHGEFGLLRRWRVGRSLRARGYAQAIVLPRSLKAALIPYFAGIPRRTGFRGEHRYGLINDMRKFDPQRLDQTVRRFVALGRDDETEWLEPFPLPKLEVDRSAIEGFEESAFRPAVNSALP